MDHIHIYLKINMNYNKNIIIKKSKLDTLYVQ
jgi:hypothetical protein